MSARPQPPQLDSFAIRLERHLDWSELDVLGHANNARYFTWFEEARMAYFQATGIPTVNGQEWGPILAYTDCHFLTAVTWPAHLILCAKVTQIGNRSLKMTYGVYLKESDLDSHTVSCVAHGQGVIVLVNYKSGEKIKVSPELKETIEKIEAHSFE